MNGSLKTSCELFTNSFGLWRLTIDVILTFWARVLKLTHSNTKNDCLKIIKRFPCTLPVLEFRARICNTLFSSQITNWPNKPECYIIVGCKCLSDTNTLAYWTYSKVMQKMKCCEYAHRMRITSYNWFIHNFFWNINFLVNWVLRNILKLNYHEYFFRKWKKNIRMTFVPYYFKRFDTTIFQKILWMRIMEFASELVN